MCTCFILSLFHQDKADGSSGGRCRSSTLEVEDSLRALLLVKAVGGNVHTAVATWHGEILGRWPQLEGWFVLRLFFSLFGPDGSQQRPRSADDEVIPGSWVVLGTIFEHSSLPN